MSNVSSPSQKKVINDFAGDNFICVFILKYRAFLETWQVTFYLASFLN